MVILSAAAMGLFRKELIAALHTLLTKREPGPNGYASPTSFSAWLAFAVNTSFRERALGPVAPASPPSEVVRGPPAAARPR